MKLKRKSKAMEFFSMASMTDTIFLLLIFFMVSSTLVVPSALKVTLPRSSQQTTPRAITRIVLTLTCSTSWEWKVSRIGL